MIDLIHKHILNKDCYPDLTFVLKANILKAMSRLKKRKKKNRYDKFSKNFYDRVQKAFIKIAKKNKKRCIIIDNSKDSIEPEKLIFSKVKEIIKL